MKKNSRKTIAIAIVLVVVILVTIYAVVKAMKNGHQFATEEVSQIANAKNEEMMADTSVERVELTEDEKIKKMEELSSNWDASKVKTESVLINKKEDGAEVNEEKKMKIPVPLGYTASQVEGENTVDGGFVIYEGEDQVTGKSDNPDVKTAQKTRNQWVWVPIYDVSEIYGTDSSGQMHGKLYNYSSNTDSKRTPYNWSENEDGVMTVTSTSNYREPDLVTSYDKDNYLENYLTEETREELDKEMQENFETTIESIKKYGGFYIGRYETGGLSADAKVVKQNEDISSQTWYTMYEKSKELGEDNDSVETSMIWGCLWDATLQWLIDTEAVKYDQVGKDSKEWGNYKNVSFQYENSEGQQTQKSSSSTKIPTGSSDHNKKNNIFDIAGNVHEWTLEANSTYKRVCRGGYYGNDGGSYPAHYRSNSDPNLSVSYLRHEGSTFRSSEPRQR